MTKKSKDNIVLDALYELKDLISDTVEKFDTEQTDSRTLIDCMEDCLVDLNNKTQIIYLSMLSKYLSTMETNEIIESKKAFTLKRGGD